MKLTLNNISSQNSVPTAAATINGNSDAIETALENTLSRDGTSPNQMRADFDMNSHRVLNLPAPINAEEPLRYQDLSSFVGGGTVTNIPIGGASGDVLTKTSDTNYDIGWSHVVLSVLPGTNINVTGSSPATVSTVPNPNFTTSVTTPSLILNGTTLNTKTGSGAIVLATSPTLVTPALGTPSSGVATNLTGTAAGLTAGTVTTNANLTGAVTSVGNTSSLGSFTSLNLKTALTDETGSGAAVFANSPALVTPTGIVKGDVGLGNVDNTSDATQNAAVATLTNKTLTTPVLNGTVTGTSQATANTASTLVMRDASGNFSAGTITAALSGNATTATNASTVTTNANLTGDVTSVGNATTLTNAPVIAKVLTGYTSGAGTVSATDSILSAIQKLNGNDATNANLTGDVTSVGNATTLATAQPGVHTWAPTQTFTVAPVFTDQSGSRTALGLGSVATQAASAVALTGGTINGAVIGGSTPAAITGTTIGGNTSVASPLYVGGSGTTGTQHTLQTTSGNGTTDAFAFKGGNNGGTTFGTWSTTGLGVGSVAADSLLTVNANTAASPAPLAGTYIHMVGADNVNPRITIDGYAGIPIIAGNYSNGTQASKTVAVATNNIFTFGANAWNGSAYSAAGQISVHARETFSGTASGTSVSVYTTPLTTTGVVESLRFQPSGGVSIGATAIATDPGVGNLSVTNAVQLGSFTVAGLPTGAAGKMVFCSNCRMFNGAGVQEGAGSGTGGLVTHNGTAWKIAGTNVTAVA